MQNLISQLEASFNKLNIDGLIHWSNWITPTDQKARFNTQFFLTLLSDDESTFWDKLTSPDGSETLSLEWESPKEALRKLQDKGSCPGMTCLMISNVMIE